MAKTNLDKPEFSSLNCKAVTAYKVTDNDILSTAFEFEIKNGTVVSVTRLCPPNVPAVSIGRAVKLLWKYLRSQKTDAE